MGLSVNRWRVGVLLTVVIALLAQAPTASLALGTGVLSGSATYNPSLTTTTATRDVTYAFGISGIDTAAGPLGLDCHLEGSSSGDVLSDNAGLVGTCVNVLGGWSTGCVAVVGRLGVVGPMMMECSPTPVGTLTVDVMMDFVPLTAPNVGAFAVTGRLVTN